MNFLRFRRLVGAVSVLPVEPCLYYFPRFDVTLELLVHVENSSATASFTTLRLRLLVLMNYALGSLELWVILFWSMLLFSRARRSRISPLTLPRSRVGSVLLSFGTFR